jgi:hypothetical protein
VSRHVAGAELARFARELLEVGIGIKGGPLQIHGPHQRRVVGVNRRLFEERGAGGEKGHQHKGPQPPGLHQVADEGIVLALPDPVCSEQIGTEAIVGSVATGRIAADVAVSANGRYAYVGDRSNGLAIYDLANPAAPTKVKGVAGAWPVRDAAVAVAIGADNQTAYAVTTVGRLHAISLANPRSPQVTATVDLGAEAGGLGASSDGSRGLIALGAEGVAVVDLSRPTHPLLLGRIVTPGEPQTAIVTTNGQLLVAANSAGLFVQDVTPLAGFSLGGAAVTAILGGVVESQGDVQLVRTATGQLFAGEISLTRNGQPLVQSGIVGAVPLAAESLPAGNRLLLRSASGGLIVWQFDAAWRFLAAEPKVARNSSAATVLALQFGIAANAARPRRGGRGQKLPLRGLSDCRWARIGPMLLERSPTPSPTFLSLSDRRYRFPGCALDIRSAHAYGRASRGFRAPL